MFNTVIPSNNDAISNDTILPCNDIIVPNLGWLYVWFLCVCDCLFAGMHDEIKSCCKRNYSKIISNISAYISPIRLRNIAGDLAGARVRVCGWGKTSGSKYNFLIISQFYLKNCTHQIDCFKGEETHGIQEILWSL